jgi:thiamine-phosphate pyrophosphorylase
MKFDKSSLLLYAVTDGHWLAGRRLAGDVREALEGGVTFVQLREKDDMALPHDEFLAEAKEIKALCAEYHVPFVLDDDVALALECGADGVHVGQHDLEAGSVRKMIGPDKILGVSAQTVEEALLAEREGADYLGVGAVFPTGSKDDAEEVSHETLKAIVEAVSIPVIAIGGISRDNVAELSGSGISGIAVISAIFAKPDRREAAADLLAQTKRALFAD